MSLPIEALVQMSKDLLDEGLDMEDVLVHLRAQGVNEIYCNAVVRSLTGWDYAVAKGFVENSRAWSDQTKNRTELYDNAEQLLRNAEDI
jgi:hypothetical protein